MSRAPPGEEREIKIDILKMVLYDNAVCPNAISFHTIESNVAKHERETIIRYVDELVANSECPLEYYDERRAAVCFSDRDQAILFIDELEGEPWYQPDLD